LSIARLKRLQRLEAKQPKGCPYVDPFPSLMRLWVDLEAVVAGKAEWIPRPERELGEAEQDAYDRAVRNADLMNARLTAERAREI
jgi:hypothetical protein